MDILDFIGTYTIRAGCGAGPRIESGQKLFIGTNTHHDPPPSSDGQVGLSVYSADGLRAVFPEDPENDPALFRYVSERLIWQQEGTTSQERLYVEISLSRQPTTGGLYKAPYTLVLAGDPEQVGSWGADNQP